MNGGSSKDNATDPNRHVPRQYDARFIELKLKYHEGLANGSITCRHIESTQQLDHRGNIRT
jgi:hypothetical protein